MRPARYVWHHELHSQAGETLFFVRLYFEPVFPDVVEQLTARLDDLDVSSAHVYELIGAHDLLMRVWLPSTLDVRKFVEGLDLPDLRRADYMRVNRIREHWVVNGDQDTPPQLSEVAPEAIQRVNEAIYAEMPVHQATVDDALANGWLAPIHEDDQIADLAPGVKFFIYIVASVGSSPSINFEEVLFRRVRKVLDDASDLIDKRSVYAGDGFARLLLMGRFQGEKYFDFINRVVIRLNDEDMREMFIARTYTALGSRPEPVVAREHLKPPTVSGFRKRETQPPDLVRLLEQGEGQCLEVKASAFLNFDRLVTKGEPDWSNLRPEFIKAVCGLLNQLNARTATLIVGAVETPRYRQWLDAHNRRYEIGQFTVLGVEEDNPSGDWDKYQRRLMDSLASAIDPSPVPFIEAFLEEIDHDGTSSTLLRIELTPIGTPFYAKNSDVLWVRSGAQVNPLSQRTRDDFVGRMAAARQATTPTASE